MLLGAVKVKFALMGGLGNQLFQLAFALTRASNQKIEFVDFFSNARLGSDGRPAILGLNLPNGVGASNEPTPLFVKKMLGLGLRTSATGGRQILVTRFIESVLPFLKNIPVDLRQVAFATGLGFDSNILKQLDKKTFIGYFQTFRYAEEPETFKILTGLSPSPTNDSQFVGEPVSGILLHVRLKDYVGNHQFGMLGTEYYRKAIQKHFFQIGSKKIHVYSDDIGLAIKFLPKEFNNHYTFQDETCPAHVVLEQMRWHDAYIIANSTLSWWGAFLRHNQNAKVIAPKNWFNLMQEPSDLIPSDWDRIDSAFVK